jgi:hypothetical protein
MIHPSELAMAVVVFGTISGTVISLARMYYKRLEARDRAQALSGDAEDRLARMEQAIDAIAVEVERLAESQRFTTRLLTDRLGDGPALPGIRSSDSLGR